jgi:hypothetical protein
MTEITFGQIYGLYLAPLVVLAIGLAVYWHTKDRPRPPEADRTPPGRR